MFGVGSRQNVPSVLYHQLCFGKVYLERKGRDTLNGEQKTFTNTVFLGKRFIFSNIIDFKNAALVKINVVL